MATVQITLTGGQTILSATKTLSSSDLTTLQNTFTSILQEQGTQNPTLQQVFDYWVSRWVADTVNAVRQRQQLDAAKAVANISLT